MLAFSLLLLVLVASLAVNSISGLRGLLIGHLVVAARSNLWLRSITILSGILLRQHLLLLLPVVGRLRPVIHRRSNNMRRIRIAQLFDGRLTAVQRLSRTIDSVHKVVIMLLLFETTSAAKNNDKDEEQDNLANVDSEGEPDPEVDRDEGVVGAI